MWRGLTYAGEWAKLVKTKTKTKDGWCKTDVSTRCRDPEAQMFRNTAPKRSRNSVSSAAHYAFNRFFSLKQETLSYMIQVTWFDWFLHRKADSTALQEIIIHVFIAAGQIQKRNQNYLIFESKGGP